MCCERGHNKRGFVNVAILNGGQILSGIYCIRKSEKRRTTIAKITRMAITRDVGRPRMLSGPPKRN